MSYYYNNLVILIPVRMASTRLPGKALVDINGKPKIQRIFEHVSRTALSPTYIVAGDQEIVDRVSKFTDKVVLTDPDLPCGTDRIEAGLQQIDPTGGKYPFVVNFQGDAINVDPMIIKELMEVSLSTKADITTAAMLFKNSEDIANPKVAKVAMGLKPNEKSARALYFSRNVIPHDRDQPRGDFYHHVGVYVFTASALKRFVKFPPGILEQREKLEHLRALENGMTIYVKVIDKLKLYERAPADIDTPEDLEAIRKLREWK